MYMGINLGTTCVKSLLIDEKQNVISGPWLRYNNISPNGRRSDVLSPIDQYRKHIRYTRENPDALFVDVSEESEVQ